MLLRKFVWFALLVCQFASDLVAQDETPLSFLDELRAQSQLLDHASQPQLVRSFLSASTSLQPIAARKIYFNRSENKALTAQQFLALAEAKRSGFVPLSVDDRLYYGNYSTPLAWVRPLEVLADHGVVSVDSKRILDFGFGNVGQLRMLASLGASVTGVEVAGGIHQAMYAQDTDQGVVKKVSPGIIENDGSLELVFGKWPAEKPIVEEVGRNFDLIVSKNVLKLGYIHPQQEVPKRMRIDLGVSDQRFLGQLFKSLNPGGVVLIYNIHPTQSPDPKAYRPWAHGETPWKQNEVEEAGFEVVAWHVDDSTEIQSLGTKLGWRDSVSSQDAFESGFRAMYTILRRPK